FLIRRLEDVPILLLVATRPAHGEGRALLAQLVADPSARALRSTSLSREAVGSWLNATLSQEADAAFVDACHATTQQPAARVQAGEGGRGPTVGADHRWCA
ncbi:MAG TPA: hypothetical protein VF526_00135, partial [Solirubrobacteraceae bacterium]